VQWSSATIEAVHEGTDTEIKSSKKRMCMHAFALESV
jgi:hypothetical protein